MTCIQTLIAQLDESVRLREPLLDQTLNSEVLERLDEIEASMRELIERVIRHPDRERVKDCARASDAMLEYLIDKARGLCPE